MIESVCAWAGGALQGTFNVPDVGRGFYGGGFNFGIFASNERHSEDGDNGASLFLGGLHVNDPNPPPPNNRLSLGIGIGL